MLSFVSLWYTEEQREVVSRAEGHEVGSRSKSKVLCLVRDLPAGERLAKVLRLLRGTRNLLGFS